MVVLQTAPGALDQPTAVAEVGRGAVRGTAAVGETAGDDGRTTAAAAGATGGAARSAGEHVVAVHRPENEAFADRPAASAESARDPVSARRLDSGAVDGRASNSTSAVVLAGQRAEAGQTDGVQVQHSTVVHHRHGNVRRMTRSCLAAPGRQRKTIRSILFNPFCCRPLSAGRPRITCGTRSTTKPSHPVLAKNIFYMQWQFYP